MYGSKTEAAAAGAVADRVAGCPLKVTLELPVANRAAPVEALAPPGASPLERGIELPMWSAGAAGALSGDALIADDAKALGFDVSNDSAE